MNGEVLIVDEFTGRILPGRRYNEGMHQADRGQGRRADQGREPDPRHDHAAELLPPLREAVRHDRYGPDRGQRVPPDLQARRRADPDEQADGPQRPVRLRLQDRGGQVRRRWSRTSPSGTSRASRSWSAPTQRREVRAALPAAQAQGHPARGAQRQEPRAGGRDRRPGRPQGRGHRRHQHGRSRHRHHARRQPRVPRRPGAAPARAVPGRARRRTTRPPGPRPSTRPQGRRRGARGGGRPSAASTCWAPSGTSPAASTTSCAAAPAGRATRASPGSTCRSRTT